MGESPTREGPGYATTTENEDLPDQRLCDKRSSKKTSAREWIIIEVGLSDSVESKKFKIAWSNQAASVMHGADKLTL